jgi:hypothetical protein
MGLSSVSAVRYAKKQNRSCQVKIEFSLSSSKLPTLFRLTVVPRLSCKVQVRSSLSSKI